MDFETGESSAKYTYPIRRKKTIKIKQNTKENTGNMIYNYIKLYFKVAKHFASRCLNFWTVLEIMKSVLSFILPSARAFKNEDKRNIF